MAKGKSNTPAQGAEGVNEELFDHVVTQEDLDKNPELVDAGVEVGETIQIPKKDDTGNESGESKSYVVADGKSFRDKNNFEKEYKAGDDIKGFDQDRLDHLLSIGYIQEL